MKYHRFEDTPVWQGAIPLAERGYDLTDDRSFFRQGAAGEVRSMLCFVERRHSFKHLKSEISDLKYLAENIAPAIARLGGFAAELRHQRPALPE